MNTQKFIYLRNRMNFYFYFFDAQSKYHTLENENLMIYNDTHKTLDNVNEF